MTSKSDGRRFPHPPRGHEHVFAICRYDGPADDVTQAFMLTRGYWSEDEAMAKASELNASTVGGSPVYFVRPVRIADAD